MHACDSRSVIPFYSSESKFRFPINHAITLISLHGPFFWGGFFFYDPCADIANSTTSHSTILHNSVSDINICQSIICSVAFMSSLDGRLHAVPSECCTISGGPISDRQLDHVFFDAKSR